MQPKQAPHANQQALPRPETETDIHPAARTPGLQTPSGISSRDASKDNGMAGGWRGGLRGCSSPTEVGKGHGRGGWVPAARSQHLHFGSSICLRVRGWGGGSPPATPRPLANHPSNGLQYYGEISGHCNYNYQEQIRQVKYQLPREKLLCQPGGSKCQNPWL